MEKLITNNKFYKKISYIIGIKHNKHASIYTMNKSERIIKGKTLIHNSTKKR